MDLFQALTPPVGACDGLKHPFRACSSCVEAKLECRFTGAKKKQSKYVEALEARLEATQRLLAAQDVTDVAEGSISSTSSVSSSSSANGRTASAAASSTGERSDADVARGLAALIEVFAVQIRSTIQHDNAHPADVESKEVLNSLRVLQLSAHAQHFQNSASRWSLVATAVQQKELYEGRETEWRNRRARYWEHPQRPQSSVRAETVVGFRFPPPDLLASLAELYFRHVNITYPVLHRPSFLRSIADGRHLREIDFAVLALVVCALGARYSDDYRVLPARNPGESDEELELRAGARYFEQIPLVVGHLFKEPALTHVQFCALSTIYLQHASPSQCWTLLAMGIKIAQDRGVHRWGAVPMAPTPTTEGWKRAFWCLYCMDRQFATSFGQPPTLEVFDMDTDLPFDCDDEYWPGEPTLTAGSEPFMQPRGKPSYIAGFLQFLRLNRLQGVSLRLYGLRKVKALFAIRDPQWQEKIVAELDSGMNAWMVGMPQHLRWDNFSHSCTTAWTHLDDPHETFFDQAVLLHSSFYALQIYIHRQYLPFVTQNSPNIVQSLPSLAVCTTAARATARILHLQRLRRGTTPIPDSLPYAFTAALILSINVWSAARSSGLSPHMNSSLDQIHELMEVVKLCEKRWALAGLFWDLLAELSAVLDPPTKRPTTQTASPGNTRKRPAKHVESSTKSATSSTLTPFPPSASQLTLATPTHSEQNSIDTRGQFRVANLTSQFVPAAFTWPFDEHYGGALAENGPRTACDSEQPATSADPGSAATEPSQMDAVFSNEVRAIWEPALPSGLE
ncbi:Zn(2)-C6 fungal-type domain-containing protein [Mycena chlorophos]|uniref:Zn(2)-C6 fungal-type domain-containing protein n=1 Tax=Mycena chlorophos TaxID=658473 RepID=A0A8H6TGH5_MYCCL|nr:Zn(2)-C6 fungal-type domain-containing protein [Mycena chlorophos]